MLGPAVLLGLVSAYPSPLLLVLPSMSLGTMFVMVAVIALVVSRRITRLGRPSTLRWAEQG